MILKDDIALSYRLEKCMWGAYFQAYTYVCMDFIISYLGGLHTLIKISYMYIGKYRLQVAILWEKGICNYDTLSNNLTQFTSQNLLRLFWLFWLWETNSAAVEIRDNFVCDVLWNMKI